MKRFIFSSLMILFSLSVLFAEWIEIAGNKTSEMFEHSMTAIELTEVNFSLPGYDLEIVNENGVEYHKISYRNEGRIVEIGKPDLPVISRLVAIPDQGTPAIQIFAYEEEIISDVVVYPMQELQIESQPRQFEFTIDEEFYRIGNQFPDQIAQLGSPAIMRGLRVVNLMINPFRYDPVKRELKIITNLNLRIRTDGFGGENTISRSEQKLSRTFEKIYHSSVINFDSMNLRDDHFQDPSYLFIHTINTQVEDALTYLTDWKHQKGFHVATHAVNSGTLFSTIKAYIQNAYDTWENPPEYICLVGDAEGSFNIPVESGSNGDHGYVRLDGTDMLADAHIGRLSFSTILEFQTIIYKILNYEKQPFMDQTDWYTKSLLVGDPSSSGPSTIDVNQFIKEIMLQHDPDYQFTEAYSGNYSSIMSNTINSGVTYFNYRGYLGMSGFGNTQINALNNGLMLPVAVFLTCSTGTFASGTARSEAFIRAGTPGNPKGAIAAIGTATSSTHTMFNNCVDSGIFYGLFAEKNFNMGSALTRGKLHLYTSFYQSPSYVQNFSYWNNLMGDPGMELWSGVPQPLYVNYNNQIALGTNTMLVTVQENMGQPVENAWVTALLGDDDIFEFGYTDANGEVILNIDAQDAGTATLTVTKHNYIPHLGSFDVGQADRFVNVENYQIDDDNNGASSGNNNNLINPGETIELTLGLKNHGSSAANGVNAVISTDDDFVTITGSNASYGNIPAGNTVYSTAPFVLAVDPSALGGIDIHLQVEVEDNLGNIWIDYLNIPVEGAHLIISDYSLPNNLNGILDPGETSNLAVTVQNLGLVTANNVYGSLELDDSWFTINDNEGYFGNIIAGGQVSNLTDVFNITAAAQIIPGSQFVGEITLYNSDGYQNTTSFLLSVGEASVTDPLGPDAYGYYCYDDEDVDYYNVPVYDWIDTSSGTQLTMNDSGDEGAIADITDLPISFRYYGIEYNSLTVCSNGWIAPGDTDAKDYMNWQIPGPGGPNPMIAVFWDDLKTGNVKYLYDSAMNYLVITWNMLSDFNNDPQIFQIILYDANYYPTATGDSEIKMQYQVFNNTNSGSFGYPYNHGLYSTIGLEDHTGTRGLQYTFNNVYPPQAKVLSNQSALLFTGAPIQFDEPYLVLGGVSLDDANGNGQADYGETVNLEVMLNNLGDQSATGVSAVISTGDPNITITENISNYNIVPGSGSSVNLTPFTIEIAEDCPDGHIVPFTINVTSDQADWELYFTVELHAPIVIFNSIFVDDGDNNILDPGETADIFVSFENTGGSAAYNLLTLLTENDPYVELNSNTHSFTVLNSGSIGTAIFNVTALISTPIGHTASIQWEMNGDLDYTASGTFPIIISQVPVMMEEDFSGTFPPTGWATSGGNNWQQGTGNNAGGASPEARFYWSPSTTAAQRLISPSMNTIGSQTLQLSFRHYLDHFSGAYAIRVQTTSNGSTWNDAWSIVNPTGNVGPELIEIDVTTPDVGSADFQIAWVFDGYSWNVNNWYVDDILLEGGQGAQLGFINGTVSLIGGSGNVQNAVVNAGNFSTSPDASGYYTIPLPAGSYDMTVQLTGYTAAAQNSVNVVPGVTTTVDFTLTALEVPQNLSATATTNDVHLLWEMPAADEAEGSRELSRPRSLQQSKMESYERTQSRNDERTRNLTGFKVYRNNMAIASLTDPSNMEYLDEYLAAGDYQYHVTAVYDDIYESSASNTEQVTIVLLPPTDLQATALTDDIELNWTAPQYSRSLSSYRIYRNNLLIDETQETYYLDEDPAVGIYTYYVTALYGPHESPASNEASVEMTESDNILIPETTALLGNYPNPFNPSTEISFALVQKSQVIIEVFNPRGQRIITLLNDVKPAGIHRINWNGSDENNKQAASGIYFYKMKTEDYVQTKKMILLR